MIDVYPSGRYPDYHQSAAEEPTADRTAATAPEEIDGASFFPA